MSGKSKIEWTQKTWNPVRGCSEISPGCANCYAARQAIRYAGALECDVCKGEGGRQGRKCSACRGSGFTYRGPFVGFVERSPLGTPRWTKRVELLGATVLEAPLRWREPATVFVNSMSDLFHEALTDEQIEDVFAIMALASRHTFQVLTKRARRMRDWLNREDIAERMDAAVERAMDRPSYRGPSGHACFVQEDGEVERWPLPNVQTGVSVENQRMAEERLPLLLEARTAFRFVSVEPMVEAVDLMSALWNGAVAEEVMMRFATDVDEKTASLRPVFGLDWVIVGGESGPKARACELGDVRRIVRQCRRSKIPIFVKQLGAHARARAGGFVIPFRTKHPRGGDPLEWPKDLRVREMPAAGR